MLRKGLNDHAVGRDSWIPVILSNFSSKNSTANKFQNEKTSTSRFHLKLRRLKKFLQNF